jgi:hypothetical protein
MMAFISYLLTGFAMLLAVPTGVFLLEIMAAIFLPKRDGIFDAEPDHRGRVAVLVPAHNESVGLEPTLADLTSQLLSGDRLLVVADNCNDDTAAVATSMGAEVTVRNDPTKIGKGYALDWGLNHLAKDAPDLVIIVDADCRVGAGAIERLARVCEKLRRPVQALYLMTAPLGSAINHQVAEFAWRLKNRVRPLGLNALGLPCQLMGTGMAFPWEVIRSAELANGFIVEDLKLGLELADAGHAPVFCPLATVTSTFPTSAEGANAQRQRWEHGHVGLILGKTASLLYSALRRGNLDLLALSLDLLVPPLSLFGLLLGTTVCGAAIATVAGAPPMALIISTACLLAVIATIILSWIKFGRDILPPGALASIGPYGVAKIRSYLAVLFGRRVSRWHRADRN